ncbi:MAG TPA: hypothetical protein GX708_19035 [Gallicola sp.]|nr:hypothetical protein [Gallicola sp.]
MNILAHQESKFTNFLNQAIIKGKELTRLNIVKALENKDKEIASKRDLNS